MNRTRFNAARLRKRAHSPIVVSTVRCLLALLIFQAFALLTSCRAPATQVQFTVDTDLPITVPGLLQVTVRWRSQGSPQPHTYRWFRGTNLRQLEEFNLDGGLTDGGLNPFPQSFTVVPDTERADDAFVTDVSLELADGVTLRRRFTRTLLRNQTQRVQVFLAARCLDPAEGCATSLCTLQQLCEDRGLTCNEVGECVAPERPTATEDGGTDAGRVSPQCGRANQACCLYANRCSDGLTCNAGRCVRCPAGSEACCDGDSLRPEGTPCGMAPSSCLSGGSCRAGVCIPGGTAPNGTPCRPAASPCERDAVCEDGTCLPNAPATDGTVCDRASNGCNTDGVCVAGTCNPQQAVMDGTVCAPASSPCQTDGLCMAGTCTGPIAVADGTVCARASNPCERNGVCAMGRCSPVQPAPDGTVCATASNACQRDGTCRAGACQPVTFVANGTVCATASDPCQVNGTCSAGNCTGTTARPNGTVCAMASNACQINGTCTAGRCGGVSNVPNGTVCARAANSCQIDSLCNNGSCPAVGSVANGTVCAPTSNPCLTAGTCTTGTCGPIRNRANGTVCGAATNCRNAPTCQTGACAAGSSRADNTRPTATTHCCAGAEVSRASTAHCNVCNLACPSGSCAAASVGSTQWFCGCSGNAQCTPQLCRIGQPSLNNRCACRDGSGSAECPGAAVCQSVSGAPNYCRP
ncbi:MAG: hypothetical protein Q8Q09_04015 [Deltaproteobacteria bacterium]|nr:hypothetical protein [Deltaproteobacteria bacterium]